MLSNRHERARQFVRYPVLQLPKLELCFNCGQRLWLQQVNNDPLVRLVEHENRSTAVDLRDLCPSLEGDFHSAATNDRAAVIFFTLRQQFAKLADFMGAVQAMPVDRRRARELRTERAPEKTYHFTSGSADFLKSPGDRRFFVVNPEARA